ncbi:family 16 glycoside hydrolase [Segetibacter aerophilus]|uniref:3-keto-alpha-glucoside-1,2-lyase/3-keto-2-hydroxy-glucal hydratase domain-containing protein n=1 Tax=Segetibacter aerophilus TaxID=670293 RepID=A0A512BB72_9BACT|nr:family 16 glycoside hydrolase [Segetibacter aerophilus]GEO09213.1 hypothetical protein SAE01_17090 [Segetibacter aerophilus]
MKIVIISFCLLILATCIASNLNAQVVKPDLQNLAGLKVINRSAEAINEDGKKAIRISEAANEGFVILKEIDFSNGTIEFDVKGKNVVQQSFVGFAFHGQDEKTYDAIYFRPFNFVNPDTARRRRAVQYVSMPNYPWEKLRETFPGKYENKVNPVPNPDGWFHAKITINGKRVAVFVDNATTPSLEVEKLTSVSKGGVALWVGNSSGGSFANLSITNLSSNTGAGNK